jgi:hypothetical protein
MVGAIVGPEEAYRLTRGEEVKSNHGLPVKLKRSLDSVGGGISCARAMAGSTRQLAAILTRRDEKRIANSLRPRSQTTR